MPAFLFSALVAVLSFVIGFSSGPALAQSAKDLIGTWTLVSVTLDEGGKKREPFGPNPKGMASFNGTHQSTVIFRGELPKFASKNRMTGTAEENKAVVQGSLVFFGTYSYDETTKSMTMKIDGSSFANWSGAQQKRSIALQGDILTISNPVPSASGPGGIVSAVWRRAK